MEDINGCKCTYATSGDDSELTYLEVPQSICWDCENHYVWCCEVGLVLQDCCKVKAKGGTVIDCLVTYCDKFKKKEKRDNA